MGTLLHEILGEQSRSRWRWKLSSRNYVPARSNFLKDSRDSQHLHIIKGFHLRYVLVGFEWIALLRLSSNLALDHSVMSERCIAFGSGGALLAYRAHIWPKRSS